MKPKRIYITKDQLRANYEFYKYKRIKYRGISMVFDQDIRKGVCYFCGKSDKKGETSRTILHHLIYDDSDPLAWTIEICPSCHYKVDEKNKIKIDMFYSRRRIKS